MALTVNYLAQTLWNHPIYGVIIAPFIACSRNAKEMVEALEAYEGTIVWKVQECTSGILHTCGSSSRVAAGVCP
jgi:hypothetical protein